MGNKNGAGKDLISTANSWFKLDGKEKEEFMLYLNLFMDSTKKFDSDKFISDSFMILDALIKKNIVNYLNSYYESKENSRRIKDALELNDYLAIANILLRANSDYDDSIYYRKNTFLILYDMIKGKIGSFQNNANSFNLDDLLQIFNFATLLYFNKYAKHSSKFKQNNHETFTEDFNKEMKEYIYDNIMNGSDESNKEITLALLEEFIDNKLYALDGFLKNHFRTYFLNRSNDDSYSSLTPFPLFNDPPSTIPSYQFFYYCLSNTIISSKSYAFKLYDCKIQGYNLSDLIYSFLGFTGPIAIFTQHYDEKKEKNIILGMFINSNFKECYEKFCGDDMSCIFTIEPKMNFYKCVGDKDKICFISSKNQKFSKTRPGIGLGWRAGDIRFWLDANELFSKSYFSKYDNVFEEGSPFEEMKEKLNIGNIEVFGFGNEDDLESLMKKQERDKNVCDKMKKVDKSAFANNDFDKEMFFGKTFQHRGDIDERGMNDKKENDK